MLSQKSQAILDTLLGGQYRKKIIKDTVKHLDKSDALKNQVGESGALDLKKKVVSDARIVVPRIPVDKVPVKGADLGFKTKYFAAFACSMRGSGKSTVLYNILWKILGKDTKVIICSPTAALDPTYIKLTKDLEKKGYGVEVFPSIILDDGTNVIKEFMDNYKESTEDEEEQEPNNSIKSNAAPVLDKPSAFGRMFTPAIKILPTIPEHKEEEVKKIKKIKMITPEYVIIIDDCGASMRDAAVGQLLRTLRHYHTVCLCSSQHPADLMPGSWKNINYVMLFPKFGEEKLKNLYDLLDIQIPFEKFLSIYRDATNEKYEFLFIGRNDGAGGSDVFRKKFNEQYLL